MTTVFEGRSLSCVRGERMVFAGLDFAVGAGDALVLVGANGSGKSTLLRLMAGLTRPANGAVTWHGADIRDDAEAHGARLHYIGHQDAVKGALTAGEQVATWTRLHRPAGAEHVSRHARAALDRLGIGHLADLPGRYLSAGQRRRVNLARLLAAPAALWLLDEPSTGLDRDAVDRLDAAIDDHRRTGGIVVLALHGDKRPDGARVLDLADYAVSTC